MTLIDLVTKLMTEDELATSRAGVLALGRNPDEIISSCAETVVLDGRTSGPAGPACELIYANIDVEPAPALSTAMERLTRDAILVADVPLRLVEAVKRVILASGPYWVAVLQADGGKRLVVAGMETHPGEFGTLLSNYLVSPVPSTCILLPQNKNDRWRRRLVRRRGGARLMALAAKLHQEHGEAVRRIVTGIELLAGERTAKPALDGKRPGMFSLPDLQAEAWPTPERWHRLETAINICNRHGMKIRKELREFIAQKSLPTYLDDDYNKNKFGVEAANNWRALRLIDWRNHRSELPDHCHATHQMLTELDDRISGEANILRVGPNTSLPPHFDDYDCEVYIHIGLTIPSECGIRVGERAGTWVEGRALAFNPAYLHEVWNHSEQARDVLAIDTWHPDLSGPEIQALQEVRDELEVLRQQRNLKRAV